MTKHGRQLKTQQQQHARQQQQQHKDQLAAAAAPPPPPTKQQQQQSSEPGATTFADTAAAADTTPAAGAETTAMAPAGAGAGGGQRGGDARIVTSLPGVPVTQERKVPVGLDAQLPHPGLPRANKAATAERPDGTPDASIARPDYTVLQQHVAFFDRDGDGVIWPWDTFVGFRRIGFNVVLALLAVPFIHLSFSYATVSGWLPDPFMRIFIKNMHRTKHGSDSGVYDTEGRFVPERFEELFSKWDRDGKGGLSWDDLGRMVQGHMNVADPVGWTAERLEWYMLYYICADDKGVISKERARAQFDGSLWYLLAADNEKKAAARRAAARGKFE